jgi:(heptosyl)LPS beta-1,4-glucosyltransferase
MSIKLSAVVISQNSADVMDRCLKSLGFADEIVVVDACSEDETPEIARRYGARVISNEWPGFAEQFQLAADSARGEWIFRCDTDEEVPESLAREIREIVERPGGDDAYRLRRKNQFLGKWILVGPWTNDIETRLYKRGAAKISKGRVHVGEVADGSVGWLENQLHHYAHPTLSASIHRLNWYTTLEAADRVNRRRIRVFDFIFPPFGVFLNYYVRKGCWRAGVHGFLLSAITAMYKSTLYIKIYILQHTVKSADVIGDEHKITER